MASLLGVSGLTILQAALFIVRYKNEITIIFKNYPADKRGKSALYGVTGKVEHAHFKPERAGHIHSARVAASDFADILFLEVGNEYGKVKTADKIGYIKRFDCGHRPRKRTA